jgi:hypothetical protein
MAFEADRCYEGLCFELATKHEIGPHVWLMLE